MFTRCSRIIFDGLFLPQASASRAFSSSPPLLGNNSKWGKKSTIRVKTKSALAAREARKRREAALEFDKAEKLKLAEAINVLRSLQVTSPNAMYEIYVKTQMGNGIAVPKGRFKLPREAKTMDEEVILVFAEGKLAEAAKKAGASIVGGLELVDAIVSNKIKATTYLSTTDFIKPITPKLGRFLGPQGLMPSTRRGTVTNDIAGYISRLKGTNEWRADKHGSIRMPIGQIHFPAIDVVNNFRHFMTSVKTSTGNIPTRGVEKRMPVTIINKVSLSSTQGPSIRIDDF